jgi:hypothetical protein
MVPALVAAGVAAASLINNQINASNERQARDNARAQLSRQRAEAGYQYDQMMKGIGDYYDQRGSLGTAADAEAYRKLVSGYNPEDYVFDLNDPNNQFKYTKTRDDFLNPYMQTIIGDEVAQVQHSAAGAGIGRGSGAAQAIAKAVAERENELYKEAQQEFKDDRNFEYDKYSDYIRNMQENLNQKRAAMDTKVNMQSNLANDYYNVMDARQADLIRAQQDKMSTTSQYATAMAGLY